MIELTFDYLDQKSSENLYFVPQGWGICVMYVPKGGDFVALFAPHSGEFATFFSPK